MFINLKKVRFDWMFWAVVVFFWGGLFILNSNGEVLPTINNLPETRKINEVPLVPSPPEPNEESIVENFFNPETAGEPAADTFKFLLEEVRITGNTYFTTEELLEVIQDFLQQEVSLADLERLAATLSQYYQTRGWWARAIVPAQDIQNGSVQIEIIESQMGEIIIAEEERAQSISPKLIELFTRYNLPLNQILNINTLSENMTRLDALPGIQASAVLQAGGQKGQTDVLLNIIHQPEWKFATQYDNYGSRSSGYMRLSNYLDLLGYLGQGETIAVQQIHTTGSDYERIAATFPMAPEGHQTIFSYNQLEYDLGKPNTNEATGKSSQWQAQWVQQLQSVAGADLSLTLGLSKAFYLNDINTGNSSDKDITKTDVTLNFNRPDDVMGGGITYGSVSLTAGDLNLLRNLSDYNTDQAQAKTHGTYQKINFTLNRIQTLAPQWQLNLKSQGQWALKNLDGAERFSLGGAYGVRAYPNSEATGDDGVLAQIELEHALTAQSQLKIFYDVGLISQYKSYWANWDRSNPGVDKIYLLQGAGLGWNYTIDQSSSFNVTYAFTLGSNPGEDSSGKDNDGTNHNQRLWFTFQKRF